MSKIPKRVTKEMRPFLHPAMSLYDKMLREKQESLASVEARLAEGWFDDREFAQERIDSYKNDIAKLNKMRDDGYFVDDVYCDPGVNGMFDWKGYFAMRVSVLEEQKATQRTLLERASNDDQREAVLMSIARIQDQIDSLTTPKPILRSAEAAEVNNTLKQLNKLLGDTK